MSACRQLVVVADDLGIGPETTEGILELATLGVVTGTVLLVNSPHAEHAVARWREAGEPCDLGWHPCLTLDAPVAPASEVPSLIDGHGRMGSLGRFLGGLLSGRVRREHIRRELTAQYGRFRDLTGVEPTLVNAHHHVSLFPPVAEVLGDILQGQRPRPYVRRVGEGWTTQARVGGSRIKRLALGTLGRWRAGGQKRDGLPGADTLVGFGTARDGRNDFFRNWLRHARGRVVELMCHPGRYDATLLGRDAPGGEASLAQRVRELAELRDPAFREAAGRAGFRLTRPAHFLEAEGVRDAA